MNTQLQSFNTAQHVEYRSLMGAVQDHLMRSTGSLVTLKDILVTLKGSLVILQPKSYQEWCV